MRRSDSPLASAVTCRGEAVRRHRPRQRRASARALKARRMRARVLRLGGRLWLSQCRPAADWIPEARALCRNRAESVAARRGAENHTCPMACRREAADVLRADGLRRRRTRAHVRLRAVALGAL